MKIPVSSVSKSTNSKRAQVTVVTDEGRNRRSVTHHLCLVGGKWVGFNPDERAPKLNNQYEAELAEAKGNLAGAETALKGLEKRLGGIEAKKDDLETVVDEILVNAAKAMLEGMIETAKVEIIMAETVVDDAKAKLEIVRREVPREVEFFGPGLTY